ncbi:MAG TPA: glycosyltransferase family 2 protein [Thermoclostridium sp.]|jgi:glycosyltransferase involved in cell wall biosynthesis|nr:glycosyltransferase family 2 protein [Clostridiaceae bacterium]HOJ81375.1 glycosyltransferase family 2 protein [Clostridiales bacterium]HOQ76363.1 glycosyltransferase family 2 protein [Thermoclostridium sp.]
MITILLAACNGEKHIADQIESVLNQTLRNWRLIVQDDCSEDRTCEIVEKYAAMHPDRIVLKKRRIPSGSAKDNYFSMLQYADSDYIMTCDQDDVWLPDKIEVTMHKMLEIEKRIGHDRPILVHTDLKVTDDNLNVLSESLIKYQKLDSSRDKLNNLLAQNIVTGCTMMVNRALADKAQNLPEQAIMHDWWFAMIASAFGQIGFVDKPTVLYRQHAGNAVGAKNVNSIFYKIKRMFTLKQAKMSLAATYAQAESFWNIYGDRLGENEKEIIQAYLQIPGANRMERIRIISRHDFWKTGFFRRCGQIVIRP